MEGSRFHMYQARRLKVLELLKERGPLTTKEIAGLLSEVGFEGCYWSPLCIRNTLEGMVKSRSLKKVTIKSRTHYKMLLDQQKQVTS